MSITVGKYIQESSSIFDWLSDRLGSFQNLQESLTGRWIFVLFLFRLACLLTIHLHFLYGSRYVYVHLIYQSDWSQTVSCFFPNMFTISPQTPAVPRGALLSRCLWLLHVSRELYMRSSRRYFRFGLTWQLMYVAILIILQELLKVRNIYFNFHFNVGFIFCIFVSHVKLFLTQVWEETHVRFDQHLIRERWMLDTVMARANFSLVLRLSNHHHYFQA